MKMDDIKTIVQLMSEHDLTEFRIEAEEMHLRICRASVNQGSPSTLQPIIHSVPAAPIQSMATASAPEVPNQKESDSLASNENRETINSPIVGTFYRAPSPEADMFVQIGDKVTAETVVCIVEAMKVMNEIKAEKSGVIKEILVENAQPIEYGQPLFVIE